MTLVPLARDRCPDCGAQPLRVSCAGQPALFRHGGYGHTRLTWWRSCDACRWWLLFAITSTG